MKKKYKDILNISLISFHNNFGRLFLVVVMLSPTLYCCVICEERNQSTDGPVSSSRKSPQRMSSAFYFPSGSNPSAPNTITSSPSGSNSWSKPNGIQSNITQAVGVAIQRNPEHVRLATRLHSRPNLHFNFNFTDQITVCQLRGFLRILPALVNHTLHNRHTGEWVCQRLRRPSRANSADVYRDDGIRGCHPYQPLSQQHDD